MTDEKRFIDMLDDFKIGYSVHSQKSGTEYSLDTHSHYGVSFEFGKDGSFISMDTFE